MGDIDVSERTTAPPAEVWPLLADIDAWPRWGPWSHGSVEGGGEQRPGAVRVLKRWPFTLRERVLEMEPPQRFVYEVVGGMNVHGYRGTVTLAPDADGTVVRWHSTWDRADPLTALLLRMAIRDACKRVAKAAAR